MSKISAGCGIEKDFAGPSEISLILFIMTTFSMHFLMFISVCMYLLNFQSTEAIVFHQ